MSCTIGGSPQVFGTKAPDAKTALAYQTEFDTLIQKILSTALPKETVAEMSTKLTAAMDRLGRKTRDDVTVYCMALRKLAAL